MAMAVLPYLYCGTFLMIQLTCVVSIALVIFLLLNLDSFYAVDERASSYMPVIVVMRLLRGLKRLLLLLHLYLLYIAFTHSFVIFQQLDFPHGWPVIPAQKAPLTGIVQEL